MGSSITKTENIFLGKTLAVILFRISLEARSIRSGFLLLKYFLRGYVNSNIQEKNSFADNKMFTMDC